MNEGRILTMPAAASTVVGPLTQSAIGAGCVRCDCDALLPLYRRARHACCARPVEHHVGGGGPWCGPQAEPDDQCDFWSANNGQQRKLRYDCALLTARFVLLGRQRDCQRRALRLVCCRRVLVVRFCARVPRLQCAEACINCLIWLNRCVCCGCELTSTLR